MRLFHICITAVFVLSSLCASAQDNDQSTKTYPMPRAQVEDNIRQWFDDSGYSVYTNTQGRDQIRIQAVRDNKEWIITLRHHSPLATDVQVTSTPGSRTDEESLNRLWGVLSGYNKGVPVEVESPNTAIPTPVLSVMENIVCIKARTDAGLLQFSGFVIDRSGLVLCTAHNLKDIKSIHIWLFDGRQINGELIKIDYEKDLALINVDMVFDGFVSLANGIRLVGMGDRLFSVGCPEDLSGTVFAGYVNGPPRSVNSQALWQVSMKVYPGSSGSPVFNTQGNFVAVVKARKKGSDSTGFLIPLETVIGFVKE